MLSPYQRLIVNAIRDIYRDTETPVSTVSIAMRCHLPERTMRNYLRELERIGAVYRIGRGAGWMLVLQVA